MDDIIIIGAGIAGLSLARKLSERGVHARVFDARERVGGRTEVHTLGARRLDLGATWVWHSEHAIIELARELGIGLFPSHRGGIDLYEGPEGLQRVRLPPSPVPEYRIVGGAARFSEALSEGVELELGRRLLSLSTREDHVTLEFQDETVRARRVVLALPPALLGTSIALDAHKDDQAHALKHVPVWMGDMAKVVVAYPEPFWRRDGLSGRVFSHVGPMVEVHDMSGESAEDEPALFGFVPRSRARAGWEEEVRTQLVRLFGPEANAPLDLVVKAWWDEPYTMPEIDTHQPVQQLFGHPFLREAWGGGKLFLGSTETAAQNTGHLDGAVRRANELADLLG